MVDVQFSLPSSQRTFRYRATVRNAHVNDDGSWLLGVQFETRAGDPAAERTRRELAECLYRRDDVMVSQEDAT